MNDPLDPDDPCARGTIREQDSPVPRRRRFVVADAGAQRTVAIDAVTAPHRSGDTAKLPEVVAVAPRSGVLEPTELIDAPTREIESAEQLLCRESVHEDDPDTADDDRFDRSLDIIERLMQAVDARRRTARRYANEFDEQARKYDSLADKANARGDFSGSAQWAARADELRSQARRIRKEHPA